MNHIPAGVRVRRAAAASMAVLGSAAAAAALFAAPATAHVKVSGVDVARGGYGLLTFRVPSESATASTTALAITFPADAPLVSVDTQPKPGWTATVVTKPLAKPLTDDDGNTVNQYVAEVDFKTTTPDSGIPAGNFDTFSLEAGKLPDKPEISFPTLQTYSDGSTVNWNQFSADNGKTEPDHPAPTLKLAPAENDSATATAAPSATSPTWPAWTGFGAGIAALIISIAAALRPRKTA